MSLWTPGGEHAPKPEPPGPAADRPDLGDLSAEDRARLEAMQAEMDEIRQQLLATPAAVVIANHGMGLYELAAIHLTAESPQLAEASLAIDALTALLDGLTGRLGEAEATLQAALGQLRTAYLEVHARTTAEHGGGEATTPGANAATPEA